MVATAGSANTIQVDRIPTGIFPLDLATGGGFPTGRISIVYGTESSNKSNLCLKAVAMAQKLITDKKAVWVDVEGTYDHKWAAKMGVDVDNLIVVRPEYAEQAIDITEAFLYADDVSIVVLDSIANMMTSNEIDSSVEKASVGGASLLVGRMFKKCVVSFNKIRNTGKMPPAFVAINQIRIKIGVMFGDPECNEYSTVLNFVDGRSLPIGRVVKEKIFGDVWAFDESSQSFVASPILSHHINGVAKDGDFMTITAEGHDTRNGVISATTTYTHKFLTEFGWKRADQILVGDNLISRIETKVRGVTREFLLGACCGDLHLCTGNKKTNGRGALIRIQDSKNPEYAKWKADKLHHFKFKDVILNGGRIRHDSKASTDLTLLKKDVQGRNPSLFFNEFTWLGFSIWLMDDAYYDAGHNRYTLSIGRYINDDLMKDYISAKLNDLSLPHKWHQKRQIIFTVSASQLISENVAKFIPPCMQYKLPKWEQGKYVNYSLPLETEIIPIFSAVTSIKPASKRKYRNRKLYDIHVDGTNNYCVGSLHNGVVVHNTMPGGNGVKFSSSLTVRCYGKNIMDNKIHPAMPAFKEVSFIVKKWKIPILATTGTFTMQMIQGAGNKEGTVSDWNTVLAYAKELNLITKGKQGWEFQGGVYKTLDEIKKALYEDPVWLSNTKQHIINEMMETSNSSVAVEGEDDDL